MNSRVLRGNYAISLKDVPNTANTILAGEVNANFKPWGDPVNWRDPGLGINKSPDGFGAPEGSVTQFLMLDGSVRPVSADIDPKVLRQISMPDDWESKTIKGGDFEH